jgi:hypothetical protein
MVAICAAGMFLAHMIGPRKLADELALLNTGARRYLSAIGTKPTIQNVRIMVAIEGKADLHGSPEIDAIDPSRTCPVDCACHTRIGIRGLQPA